MLDMISYAGLVGPIICMLAWYDMHAGSEAAGREVGFCRAQGGVIGPCS